MRLTSLWPVVLLLFGAISPAAEAASCCPPGGGSDGERMPWVDECGSERDGCGGDQDDAECPEPMDGDPLDHSGAPGGCCDEARTCCGAAHPVVTQRPMALSIVVESSRVRSAPFGLAPVDAALDLFRPPQL